MKLHLLKWIVHVVTVPQRIAISGLNYLRSRLTKTLADLVADDPDDQVVDPTVHVEIFGDDVYREGLTSAGNIWAGTIELRCVGCNVRIRGSSSGMALAQKHCARCRPEIVGIRNQLQTVREE